MSIKKKTDVVDRMMFGLKALIICGMFFGSIFLLTENEIAIIMCIIADLAFVALSIVILIILKKRTVKQRKEPRDKIEIVFHELANKKRMTLSDKNLLERNYIIGASEIYTYGKR